MVKKIKIIENMIGREVKEPSKSEKKNIKLIRRGLVYKKNFTKNYIIKKIDLEIKRPLLGLEPKYENQIIGRQLKNNVVQDQPVKIKDFFK